MGHPRDVLRVSGPTLSNGERTMFAAVFLALQPLLAAVPTDSDNGMSLGLWLAILSPLFVLLAVVLVIEGLGLRYIPNNRVGIVEKIWSARGSVPEGRIIALNGEAGYQDRVLRGGLHTRLWRWQYRIH